MNEDHKIDYKTFFVGLLVLSIIPIVSIWSAYELTFNYADFTNINFYETSKNKLYKVMIQSMDKHIPYGRYVAIGLHLLIPFPFLKWMYRLIKNTFNF